MNDNFVKSSSAIFVVLNAYRALPSKVKKICKEMKYCRKVRPDSLKVIDHSDKMSKLLDGSWHMNIMCGSNLL